MPSIVSFSNVSKVFRRGGVPVTALDGIDLEIERGEVFGVIGYSGAGKSTLVRLVNGLETATSGRIIVDGSEVTALSEHRLPELRERVGMIFQQFNLLHSRTVAGNVEFPLKVAHWPRARRQERVAELLDFVGLLERAHDYPEQLSGGQKQRVGIARAIAASPAVLLADEATSALDPETTQDVLRLLRRANRELGVTIVVITHEMDVIRDIADRVAVLDSGRVVEQGTTYQVFTEPASPVTRRFLRTVVRDRPGEEDVARIRALHPGRLVVLDVRDSAEADRAIQRARGAGARITIAFGGIDSIQGREFGRLTLAVDGAPVAAERAVAELAASGRIEELA